MPRFAEWHRNRASILVVGPPPDRPLGSRALGHDEQHASQLYQFLEASRVQSRNPPHANRAYSHNLQIASFRRVAAHLLLSMLYRASITRCVPWLTLFVDGRTTCAL